MKKGKIFTNCFSTLLLTIVVLFIASCSTDESNFIIDEKVPLETDMPFIVTLNTYSKNPDISSSEDIENTILFVFDQNNNFLKYISVERNHLSQAEPIEIVCPNSNKITVVAWGDLQDESKDAGNISKTDIISDLQKNLKQNNGIATFLPGDLFYGQITLNRSSIKSTTQELVIKYK